MMNGNIERNRYAKGQGKYDIYVKIDSNVFKTNTKHYPKGNMYITVLNAKTQQTVGEESIKVNHSWTTEELVDKMNDALSTICDIELMTSYREIIKNSDSDNSKATGSENKHDSSDNSSGRSSDSNSGHSGRTYNSKC